MDRTRENIMDSREERQRFAQVYLAQLIEMLRKKYA
jgi:hypothetical protein